MRYTDFRELLKDEFKNRNATRSQFSMNAFARFIGLTPGHYNDLLKKRRGLSDEKSKTICSKLSLSPHDTDFFVTSVRAEHSRSKSVRAEALERLQILRSQTVNIMKPDLFALISEWQHFAILELARTKDFKAEPGWISKELGLDVKVAKSSFDRLVALGMLKREKDQWISHKGFLKTVDDIPSLAIKSHHSQVMALARKALYDQPIEEREFTTLMVAIDASKLKLAKQKIRDFQMEMSELLTGASKTRNRLYCLGIQFFSLRKL
ncbi:MAG: TIGR02147 family protein [Proteobacteria bacterium]|nr:MAG: TIGR02147 family protein [Pseudomonadota bacterium]